VELLTPIPKSQVTVMVDVREALFSKTLTSRSKSFDIPTEEITGRDDALKMALALFQKEFEQDISSPMHRLHRLHKRPLEYVGVLLDIVPRIPPLRNKD
jgi:hypothetical protein